MKVIYCFRQQQDLRNARFSGPDKTVFTSLFLPFLLVQKLGTTKKHMRILSMVLAFQNDQSNLIPKTINSLLCVLRAVSDASSQFVNKSCRYIFFKYNFFFQNVLKWPKTDYPHIKKYTIDI